MDLHKRPTHNGLRVVRPSGRAKASEQPAARAGDDAFLDLAEPLCRLLGRDGYRALLERALYLAAEDYPLLKTVRPAIAPPGRLVGLPPIDTPARRDQVLQALGATLTALRALLIQFLGAELVQQILSLDAGDDALRDAIS